MSIMGFVHRFQALQLQRDSGDELIKDLLIYCKTMESGLYDENARLTKELKDAHLDLDDARRSRRDLQQQLNIASQTYNAVNVEHEALKNRNPYVVVLIDGDGMIFNKDLIHQGIEGGKKAANILRNAVLENDSHLPHQVEVITKVCANMGGLSKALKRDGSIESYDTLKDFTLGFTQGKASFDFIDVGHGKERADSKIKECMRWHLRNHNCKQILLGASHDAGYAPFLDEVIEPEDRKKVAIIEGPSTVRELKATGLQILDFKSIFRSEKLVDRSTGLTTPVDSNPSSSPPTWAGVTAFPAPNSSQTLMKIDSNSSLSLNKPQISSLSLPLWSPEFRYPDPPVTVPAASLEKMKRRTSADKLCNNHYLRGPCAKGPDCCFEHNYKATEDEINAIAYLSRLNPCINGQECDVENCIYGHHCPSYKVEKGIDNKDVWVCAAFGCRFGKDDHPPGTIIKHPRKEKWGEERY